MNPFELYGGSIAFSVFRNGKKIGSHKVNFKGEPECFTVKAECRLAVNLLFFTAYKFEYSSVAQWSEGSLISLDVSTKVNGYILKYNSSTEKMDFVSADSGLITGLTADGSNNITIAGNLTVQGSTTTVDSTTIEIQNSFKFEGATADGFETDLTLSLIHI